MMKFKHKKYMRLFLIALVVFVMPILIFSGTVHASDDDGVDNHSFENFISENEDGKEPDYTLDSIPDSVMEEDEKGIISKAFGAIGDGVKWGVSKLPLMGWVDEVPEMSTILPTILNFLAEVFFQLNIMLTNGVIFIMEFAYDFDVVNTLITEAEVKLLDITGISSDGKIKNTGLFGTFGTIVAISAVVYAVFIIIFRQSILESFSTLLQTVVAITLSIVILTNYSFIMTGANQLTTQASGLILGGTQVENIDMDSEEDDDKGASEAVTIKNKMSDNVWKMFVDRPFMYMMFGDFNFSNLGDGDASVGRERAESVVFQTGESRYEALIDDIKTHNNSKPLHSSVAERVAFTPLYFIINAIIGIPLVMLSLLLMMLQFWFLIIAVLAPFVFIISAIPGQIGVLKQYGKELLVPLGLKLGLSFFMLIFFIFSDVLYDLNETMASATSNTSVLALVARRPDMYLIITGVVNLIIFGSIFLLSRRILNIFSAGSLGAMAIEPMKSGVQNTAMLVGAGAGAVAGGTGGAMIGAQIGGSVGKMTTGEASATDLVDTGIRASYMKKHMDRLSDLEESPDGKQLNNKGGNKEDNQFINNPPEVEDDVEDDNDSNNNENEEVYGDTPDEDTPDGNTPDGNDEPDNSDEANEANKNNQESGQPDKQNNSGGSDGKDNEGNNNDNGEDTSPDFDQNNDYRGNSSGNSNDDLDDLDNEEIDSSDYEPIDPPDSNETPEYIDESLDDLDDDIDSDEKGD